jgi:hypothetical protein
MLGRFLCPASRLGALEADPDWTLGVISDGEEWRADLEAAVTAGADCFELIDPGEQAYETLTEAPVTVFVERPASIAALASFELGAKLRCGGLVAEAFPSDAAVAEFIATCREHDVPFKATAGLHQPFRTPDPETGALQHGFVNLLAATILDVEHVGAVVAETDRGRFHVDAHGLRWRGHEAPEGWIRLGRTRLDAFGSCSIDEPFEALVGHGILGAETALG